jgi:hypothetical protein
MVLWLLMVRYCDAQRCLSLSANDEAQGKRQFVLQGFAGEHTTTVSFGAKPAAEILKIQERRFPGSVCKNRRY